MTRKLLWSLIVFSGALCLVACDKSSPPPPPVAAPVVATPEKAPEVAPAPTTATDDAVAAAKVKPSEPDLPPICTKLLTCCDAWVKVTPTAQVGCDAQRHAFRAAKTPDAKAKLGDLCEQALAAWGQLSDIPAQCK